MQDPFTGRPTVIRERRLPDAAETAALQDDHRRRLEALAGLCAAAQECGVGADPRRDLVLLAEDEVSLLETAGPPWTTLGGAIRRWREFVPIYALADFGFLADAENPIEEANPRLRRIGSGVEASAFLAEDGSIYKFFLPREEGHIGGSFSFVAGEETSIVAEASLGTYRDLFEKLLLVGALGGMPTEVIGVTPEGAVVVKQTLGERLAEGVDVLPLLPSALIAIPARFLRAHRDHPRLAFVDGRAWFVADTHEKNLVVDIQGQVRPIDLLAAPMPAALVAREPLMADWLERARLDPAATLLRAVPDDEL